MLTTVAFDLDDTLYDEIEYCKSGFAAVSKFLADLPESPATKRIFAAVWKQFTAGNRTRTVNAALDNLGISYDDKLIGSAVKVYRNHVPKITLPQDSRDVLCQLSTKYTLALLTDGFLPAQQLKVRALGIEKFFKCVVYTEQIGRNCWKPSPAGFEKLMRTLNATPENTAYVADDEKKDFIAPNKLGFLTIQIVRSAGIHTEQSGESGAAARYVIHQISRLLALLEGL
jgi:putative hydrolase of the HAD superfamily